MNKTKKLVLTSAVIALTTLTSSVIYIPVGFAKIFPVQSVANIISAVLLGPWYAVSQALLVSVFRNLDGTGSLFAFPGSMVGALCASVLYKKGKHIYFAMAGELVGTGVIGAILASPISIFLLHQNLSVYAMMPAFFLSSLTGAILSMIVLKFVNKKTGGKIHENSTDHCGI